MDLTPQNLKVKEVRLAIEDLELVSDGPECGKTDV
jgi:hypothetical protein